MADAGLFIGWGQVVRGREDRALEVFNETVEYYGQLQADGRVESWDVALLQPHGGELAGYVMLRGSQEQIDAINGDENFERVCVQLDALTELGLSHRNGERTGHLLCDLDGLLIEGRLVGLGHVENANQFVVGLKHSVDERAQAGGPQRFYHQ